MTLLPLPTPPHMGELFSLCFFNPPHFIHTPFYVYAYAFGDCLVNALYGVYQSSFPDFEKKYLGMLSSGGSKRHGELLKPFGLDASDPLFWNKGLGVVESLIDELEQEFC